jgi:dihydroorotate dehydrogenase (fumarate)
MTDLATDYMGLRLRNPLVASPSPLSYTFTGARQLAEAGVGAIVLYSLFEEQLRTRQADVAKLVDGPAESFPEALDYVPAVMKEDHGPHEYLTLLERAASRLGVPVIASLNGSTPEGCRRRAPRRSSSTSTISPATRTSAAATSSSATSRSWSASSRP